jgi:predicted anti-sigma-YlaC factor YlaD
MSFRPPSGPRLRPIRRRLAALLCLAAAAPLAGCSMIKGMAVGMVASTLSSSGDVFTRDNDPELVADAIPFALKLYESLLDSAPKNKDLLIATCSAFTQYGVAVLETEATVLGDAKHHEQVVHLKNRAFNLYLRARDYCLRAMEVRFKGIGPRLLTDPAAALVKAKPKTNDVMLLYWTAASWGSAIALGLDKPEVAVDLPTIRVLAERALALDETWNKGALHEMMISIEGVPEVLGGSPERARKHFARAVELQNGLSPGPFLTLATGVVVAGQATTGAEAARAEFTKLLDQALAIDPEKDPSNRLVILILQRRARALLEQIDSLIPK